MKIGFGGGCHWCTEAVFQALSGVSKVEQGFIAAKAPYEALSEAVIVHYDPQIIPLKVLIEIHLRTHASTAQHSMRGKYRSAVYVQNSHEINRLKGVLKELSSGFDKPLVTLVLQMERFKPSETQFQNYYAKGPERPFCQTYIDPKLSLLRREYKEYNKQE